MSSPIDLTPKFFLVSYEKETLADAPSSFSDFVGGQSINSPTIVNQNYVQSANFITGSTGWKLSSKGDFEGNSGTFRGALIANSLDIPDVTTASSFHVKTDGDTFWGTNVADFNTNNDNALAYVLKSGVAKFQSVTLSGTVVLDTLSSGSIKSIQGWQFDGTFSATDADTVAWAGGTLSFEEGTTYTITAGNTGNISARTYIYWDKNGSAIDQENDETNYVSSVIPIGSIYQMAQSFTTSSGVTEITQFKAYLKYNTGTADIIYCDIYSADINGFPIGNSLGQISIPATTNTSMAWYTFTFSTAIVLSSSTKYAAVLSSPTSSSTFTYYWARTTSTSTYPGGRLSNSLDSGSSWTQQPTDTIFKTLYTSQTSLITTTTASDAVGANKVLIAVAKNSTTEATFQVFGGIGGLAITGGDIENQSITTGIIANDAITTALVAAGAITTTEVGDLAISTPKLAVGAVTAVKITAGTITEIGRAHV